MIGFHYRILLVLPISWWHLTTLDSETRTQVNFAASHYEIKHPTQMFIKWQLIFYHSLLGSQRIQIFKRLRGVRENFVKVMGREGKTFRLWFKIKELPNRTGEAAIINIQFVGQNAQNLRSLWNLSKQKTLCLRSAQRTQDDRDALILAGLARSHLLHTAPAPCSPCYFLFIL